MSLYTILGVSNSATDHEIKHAYRNLVKRYHPDRRSPESSHEQIVAINYAYDILSDPEKRAQYDRGFASIFIVPEPQEDPLEAYKREYKRKRWEREKKEKEERLAQRAKIYRVFRILHFGVLTFGIGLVFHDWLEYNTWFFWHVAMAVSAVYICSEKEFNSFAFGLAQWNLFVFIITLMVALS